MRFPLIFLTLFIFSCSSSEDEIDEENQISGLISFESESFLNNLSGYNIVVYENNTIQRDLNLFSDEIGFNYRRKKLFVSEAGFTGNREWVSSSYYPFSENLTEIEYLNQYDQDFSECNNIPSICNGEWSCIDNRSEFDFNIKTKILSNSPKNIEFGIILTYECRNGEGASNSGNANYCANGVKYYFTGNIFNLNYEGYEVNSDSTEVTSNYGKLNIKTTKWYSNSINDLDFDFDDVIEIVNTDREPEGSSNGKYSNDYDVEFELFTDSVRLYGNNIQCMIETDRDIYYDKIDELIANAIMYFD